MPDLLKSKPAIHKIMSVFHVLFGLKLMLFDHYNGCSLIEEVILSQTKYYKEPIYYMLAKTGKAFPVR